MNDRMHRGMLEAIRLTRAGWLTDATTLLQRLLRGETAPRTIDYVTGAPDGRDSDIIEVVPTTVELTDPQPLSRTGKSYGINATVGKGDNNRSAGRAGRTARTPMPDALRGFVDQISEIGLAPGTSALARPFPAYAPDIAPNGGQFIAKSYSNQARCRAYKLYIPSGYREQPLPLIVMLRGCTQSPDDFAAGTRMNALAEAHTCLVVYSLARYDGSCPRWIAHNAFAEPGTLLVQVAGLPDGATYLCFARAVTEPVASWGEPRPVHVIAMGCAITRAADFVYANGLDLERSTVGIGLSCRPCERPH